MPRKKKSKKKTDAPPAPAAVSVPVPPAFDFRPYQRRVFDDRESGILILHWSRQVGKSHTLAAWAVDRLLSQLAEHDAWLVTVLSNSRENGAEFAAKCGLVCNRLGLAWEAETNAGNRLAVESEEEPPALNLKFENMRWEVRIRSFVEGREHIGRIKVLAANPRTARGFSGDLILDEFAFHEDSHAIWEAAEPILSSNAQFLCRIASTGNGKHNLFYRMAAGAGPDDGTPFTSAAGFTVSRLTRTEAWKQGVPVFDPNTRRSITPDEARRKALDKRAYDQNYECRFNDENMALLTAALIQQAERGGLPIDEQAWSAASLARLQAATGELFVGQDVGRQRDLSVQAVLEKSGPAHRVIAMLRMAGLRLPDQQRQLDAVCALPNFRRAALDMTGIGLGLVEYAQEQWGSRIVGVNFSSTEPINDRIRAEGRRGERARVTELMATDLLAAFEERSLELHVALDAEAADDLRKPERLTTPGGRVSIAAVRDEAGHADHFWALALALRAASQARASAPIHVFEQTRASRSCISRRERWVTG